MSDITDIIHKGEGKTLEFKETTFRFIIKDHHAQG